jgi:hypothetical protein
MLRRRWQSDFYQEPVRAPPIGRCCPVDENRWCKAHLTKASPAGQERTPRLQNYPCRGLHPGQPLETLSSPPLRGMSRSRCVFLRVPAVGYHTIARRGRRNRREQRGAARGGGLEERWRAQLLFFTIRDIFSSPSLTPFPSTCYLFSKESPGFDRRFAWDRFMCRLF